jgi:hypothetical protein
MQVSFIDPNNVDYRDSWPAVGAVDAISSDGADITAKGSISREVDESFVLLVDAAGRFVACKPVVKSGDFSLSFAAKHKDTSVWPLRAYLYDPDSNKAFPIALSNEAARFDGNREAIPSITEKLQNLCIDAMKVRYTSISSERGIKTGNNYQSIDFDKTLTVGGRPARNIFFDHVEFRGATALDIGANTGEQSRLARKRGASLVDGIEYDPYFVRTGRAINAATNMTRVSLFQGDATNPDTYSAFPAYSMLMCFAVWVYIDKVLDTLAEKSDVVFFETHTLDHGLDMYTRPMTKHWPHFRIMGYDQKPDMRKSRCVLMFAKTKEQLDQVLKFHTVKTEPYFDNKFFERHEKTTPGEFAAYAKNIAENVVTDKTDFTGIGLSYFELFLAGYHQYSLDGGVNHDNIFLRKYAQAIKDGRIDKQLKYLIEKEELLFQKIDKKYQDVTNIVAGRWHLVPPVMIRPGNGKLTFTFADGRTISSPNLDGHHRFFMAQLLGKPTTEAMLQEPLDVERKTVKNDYRL